MLRISRRDRDLGSALAKSGGEARSWQDAPRPAASVAERAALKRHDLALVALVNADFMDPNLRHLFRQSLEVFSLLNM